MPPRKGQAKGGGKGDGGKGDGFKGEGGGWSSHKGGYKGEEKGEGKGSGKGKKGGGGGGKGHREGREEGGAGKRGGRKGGKADYGYDNEEYGGGPGAEQDDWGGTSPAASSVQRSQLNSAAPDFTPSSLAYGAMPVAADMKQMWGWQGPGGMMPQMLPLWREYKDQNGVPYFYNSKTGLSQWERPAELDPPRPAAPSPPDEGVSPARKLSTDGASGPRREGGRAEADWDDYPRRGGPGDAGRDHEGGRGEVRSEGRGEARERDGGGRGGQGRGGKRRDGGGGKPSKDSGAKKDGSECGPPGCNLFVFHLPDDWTDDDLHEYFAPHGNVVSAKVMKELGTGRSRGFGFVSYEDRVSAATAIKKMQGYKILGKRLKVEFKKGEREGRGAEAEDRGGDGSEDDEGGPSKKGYPDDERLIGYLRAISAKNVVQTLKESETVRPQDEGGECGESEIAFTD
mmetsp:Transcript_62846/g.187370  ORF Transcript_62846/g.187370 Transcript_62846/m.187370 type:complete len:455 (-) Transcript_62846:107-1471(-)